MATIPAIGITRWAINSQGDIYRLDGYVGIGTDSPGGLLGLGSSSVYIDVVDGNITFTDASGTRSVNDIVQANVSFGGALDGYASDQTVSEHHAQFSQALQTILKDLDGYGTSDIPPGALDGYASDQTVSEHHLQLSQALQTVLADLDGYAILSVENQRWTDASQQRQEIRDALDGYAHTSDLAGLVTTEIEHYVQHSDAVQTIRKDLDGYASVTDLAGLTQTEAEHYQQHSDAIQTVISSLDGYSSDTGLAATVEEHKNQFGEAIDTIRKDLDGYALASVEDQRWTDSSEQRQEIRDALDGYALDSDLEGIVNTELEHYVQHSDVFQSVRKDLDGYASKTTEDQRWVDSSEQRQNIRDAIDGYSLDYTQVTSEPTGFPNRTDSTISFSDGLRRFSIAPTGPSFDYYIKGVLFTETTTKTVDITDTEGLHFIYFDGSTLTSTTTFSESILKDYAYVSIVYWDATNSTHVYFADERHGLTMDWATHLHMHTSFGAQYTGGLAVGNITADGDGDSNAHGQLSVDDGSFRDEDLLHTITDGSPQTLSFPAEIPVLYRSGANGDWRVKTADTFPIIYSGTAGYTGANGRLPYNEYTGSTWQLTEVPNGDFVLVHLLATNDTENPIVAIQGQDTYTTLGNARENAVSFVVEGLPFAEIVPIATIIFQSRNGDSNTIKGRIRSTDTGDDYVDLRGFAYTPTGSTGSHSNLSNLGFDASNHSGFQRKTYEASVDPSANHDGYDSAGIGISFAIGSFWTNIVTQNTFACQDNALGAAVWDRLATGAEFDGLSTTEAEHYQQHSDAIQIVISSLDGYSSDTGLAATVEEHKNQFGEAIETIRKDLDGYALASDLDGLYQTESEHYQQHSDAIQTVISSLDGYSSDTGLASTVEEHKNQFGEAIQTIRKDLDGYGQTEQEHHTQISEAIQTIRKDLDGYGNVSSATGADGYVAFFTGSSTIAGDNDLFWNRTSNRLGIGADPAFVDAKLHVRDNTDGNGELKVENQSDGAASAATVGIYSTPGGALGFLSAHSPNYSAFSLDGVSLDSAVTMSQFGGTRMLVGSNTGELHLVGGGLVGITVDGARRVGIATKSPHEALTISGVISLQEQDTYARVHDGYGSIWVKSDGTLKFTNDSGLEFNLALAPGTLDAYAFDSTVSEHYQQHSEAIQAILQQLDGYSTIGGEESGVFATEGADGYIAFFTGPNTISGDNDLFFDRESHNLSLTSGGRVGIGTTTPGAFIHVVGEESAGGSSRASLRLEDSTTSTSWTLNTFGTGASEGGGNFGINLVGGGNRVILTTGGRVGVGASTPDALLHVAGDGYFDGYLMPRTDNMWGLGTPDLRWRDLYLGPGSLHIITNSDENDTDEKRDWNLSITSDGDLGIRQASDKYLTIANNGDVDVREELTIGTDQADGVRLKRGSGGSTDLHVLAADGGTADVLSANYTTTGNQVRMGNNWGVRFGSSLGIGFTSSSASSSVDTEILRDSAGVVKVTDGGSGLGNIKGKHATDTGHLATAGYVQSRGLNLVTNGYGLLDDLTNFSEFDSLEAAEIYGGGGSFSKTGSNNNLTTDELIPIDPELSYRLTFAIKGNPVNATAPGGGQRYYSFVSFYDADGLQIQIHDVAYTAGTETTLAAPLAQGDTQIELTDSTNWPDADTDIQHFHGIAFHPYTNSKGYTYPDYSYTRNAAHGNSWDQYYNGSIDYGTHIITLSAGYNGPSNPDDVDGTWPAGTKVVAAHSGGTYKYIGAVNENATSDWVVHTGVIGGLNPLGETSEDYFYQGTAYAKIGWLLNRDATGDSTTIIDRVEFAPTLSIPQQTISSSSDYGVEGQMASDSNYLYRHDGTQWTRIAWDATPW